MKTLLAFCGNLGSGKGYHMMKMVEELKTTGNTIYMVSFADPIKQILRNSFGFTKTGKTNAQFPQFTNIYIKHQIIDSLYGYIKDLKYEKFDISEQDAKAYIANNYDNYEIEFSNYVIGASTGRFPENQVDSWDSLADYNYCFRRLGQLLGTELGRYLFDTIWVDIAFNKIKTVFKYDLADYATIDDCRFVNEFDMIESFRTTTAFDSKVYGIVASDETRATRRNITLEELKSQDSHASEKDIDIIISKLPESSIIQND